MSVRDRFADLHAGLRCLPDRHGWRKVALELGWPLPLMLVVAHLGALVRFAPEGDASTLLRLGATLLIVPALAEELEFIGRRKRPQISSAVEISKTAIAPRTAPPRLRANKSFSLIYPGVRLCP
jgi:hypothetical protein